LKAEAWHRTADHGPRSATRPPGHLRQQPRRCGGDASPRSDRNSFGSSPETPCKTGGVADARRGTPARPPHSGGMRPSAPARYSLDRLYWRIRERPPCRENGHCPASGGAGSKRLVPNSPTQLISFVHKTGPSQWRCSTWTACWATCTRSVACRAACVRAAKTSRAARSEVTDVQESYGLAPIPRDSGRAPNPVPPTPNRTYCHSLRSPKLIEFCAISYQVTK
jgi:hypothetical protein